MPHPYLDSAKFLRSVGRPTAPDGCWSWIRSKNNQGYGIFEYSDPKSGKRRSMGAHRASYLIHHNMTEFPEDTPLVLHQCDNPQCTNPDHLFLGTHKANSEDMYSKGRNSVTRKFAPRKHILSEEDVRSIRDLVAQGMHLSEIALRFGLSGSSYVRQIYNRKAKAHVTDDGPRRTPLPPLPDYLFRVRIPTTDL